MSFGFGLAGFANGLSGGLDTGAKLYGLVQQDELAKVRAQGMAEAQAAQAAATPKVTDLGDQNNLTANPQQSVDPNAQPEPVNTSLTAAIQHAGDQQSAPDADARAAGIRTYAVDQPSVQADDPINLNSIPKASSATDGTPDAMGQSSVPNLDSAAKSGLAPLTPSKRFNVDGQGFDTQEEAAAYVKKNTPQLESFFKDTLIPKMTATLIAQGKPDVAEAWEKYADQEDTRQHMATWGKAVKLAQLGDYDGSASELMKLHPHYQDGYDLVSATPTKGDQGQDGFTMKIKAPDGSTQTVYQDAKTLTQMGLAQLSPIEMFQKQYEVQTRADQMQAKAKYDQQNDERTMNRSLAVAGVQFMVRQKIAETNVEGRKEVAKTNNDAKDARQATSEQGKDSRQQKALQARSDQLAQQLKANGQFKKSDTPEQMANRMTLAVQASPAYQMESDPDKKRAMIEDGLKAIERNHAKYGLPAPTSAVPATPQQQGLSQPAPRSVPQMTPAPVAPPGKLSVPVIDPVTGQMKYVFR